MLGRRNIVLPENRRAKRNTGTKSRVAVVVMNRKEPRACTQRRIGHAGDGSRGRTMTEAEWLACDDPALGLRWKGDGFSDRKLRLFACACVRGAYPLIQLDAFREAVELAEALSEGCADEEARAAQETRCLGLHPRKRKRWDRASQAATLCLSSCPRKASEEGSYWAGAAQAGTTTGAVWLAVREHQARLQRDIFGNPYRPAAFFSEWRTDTAVAIARGMYESRDFSTMPILADALQDAGCDNDDILNHCRSEGIHVRGCWLADLVLGKE